MSGFLSAIAPFASTIGGGLGAVSSFFGQKETNAMNLAIARENRAFQERMSNTANQRAAKDLEAAGLNRILALGKPASTPAGNVATMQNPAAAAAAGFGAMSGSVNDMMRLSADLDYISKRADLTEKQTMVLGALAELGSAGGDLLAWARKTLEDVDWKSVYQMLKSDLIQTFGIDNNDPTVQILIEQLAPQSATAIKGYEGIKRKIKGWNSSLPETN